MKSVNIRKHLLIVFMRRMLANYNDISFSNNYYQSQKLFPFFLKISRSSILKRLGLQIKTVVVSNDNDIAIFHDI